MKDLLTPRTPLSQEEIDRAVGQQGTEFGKGMRSGTLGMRQGLSNAMGAVGDAAGYSDFARDQYNQADELGMRAQNAAPRVTSVRAIKGVGDAMDWGLGVAGGLLPSAAVGVGAGMLTGGAAVPAMLAGTAAYTPFEVGDVVGRQREAGQPVSLRDAGISGLGSAALQSIVPAGLAGKAMGQVAKVPGHTLGRAVAKDAAVEGFSEAGGEVAKQLGSTQTLDTLDTGAVTDAFAGGVLGGGLMGGAGHVVQHGPAGLQALGQGMEGAKTAATGLLDRAKGAAKTAGESELGQKAVGTAEGLMDLGTKAAAGAKDLAQDAGKMVSGYEIPGNLSAIWDKAKAEAKQVVQQVAGGEEVIGDKTKFASAAKDKLTGMFAENDGQRVEQVKQWASELANEKLTPEQMQALQNFSANVSDKAAQAKVAGIKLAKEGYSEASKALGRFTQAVTEQWAKRKPAGDSKVKKSEDYSGIEAGIMQELMPVLAKARPELAEGLDENTQRDLARAMRLTIRDLASGERPNPTALTALLDAVGPEHVTDVLKAAERAIGTTDKQETARLFKGLLMTDDLMREKASLLDTLKKSLKPGIPYQVTPEMLRNDADGLAAWQDHYKANSTDPKSQLLDREMRAALAERYGDKVDVVLEAAQRGKYAEDNILAGVMGEDKSGPGLEAENVLDGEPLDTGIRPRETDAEKDIVVTKSRGEYGLYDRPGPSKTTRDGTTYAHPTVQAIERMKTTHGGERGMGVQWRSAEELGWDHPEIKAILDKKVDLYMDDGLTRTEAEEMARRSMKDKGLVTAEGSKQETRINKAELDSVKWETKYKAGAAQLKVPSATGEGEVLVDAVKLTRLMEKRLHKGDENWLAGEESHPLQRKARMFKEGVAALQEHLGQTFDIPDTTVIDKAGTVWGDVKNLTLPVKDRDGRGDPADFEASADLIAKWTKASQKLKEAKEYGDDQAIERIMGQMSRLAEAIPKAVEREHANMFDERQQITEGNQQRDPFGNIHKATVGEYDDSTGQPKTEIRTNLTGLPRNEDPAKQPGKAAPSKLTAQWAKWVGEALRQPTWQETKDTLNGLEREQLTDVRDLLDNLLAREKLPDGITPQRLRQYSTAVDKALESMPAPRAAVPLATSGQERAAVRRGEGTAMGEGRLADTDATAPQKGFEGDAWSAPPEQAADILEIDNALETMVPTGPRPPVSKGPGAGATKGPKAVAAKKAALQKAASSGDPALLNELASSNDAKGLQRAVQTLVEGKSDANTDAAIDAANARLGELVSGSEDVAYGLGIKKYSLMGYRLHEENGYEGFPATHDSPIRHEGKFDWRTHSGKGEGAMFKGAGTYLSTSESVNKYYKGMFTAKVEPEHNYMAADRINAQFHRAVGARTEVSNNAAKIAVEKGKDEAVAFVQQTLDEHFKDGPEATISQAEFDRWTGRYEKLLGAIKAMPESEMRPKRIDGFRNDKAPTYEVSVNIADEQLLKWDKPAHAQSGAVEQVMRNAGEEFDLPSDVLNRGEDFYRALSDHFAPGDRDTGDRQASDYLQAAGILGHRMKASAKDGVDRPNYVIYDDSKITTNYVHFDRQRANPGNAQGPAPDRAAVEAHLLKTLGPKIDVQWLNILHAGEHERMGGGNAPIIDAIRLSVHSLNPMGPAYHESVHAFFAKLTELKQGQIMGVLEKAAQSAPVLNQLRTLLKGHPEALAQLSNPEERVAYMYQFWAQGKLQVGEHTKNVFEKIADFIRSVMRIWSNDQHALHILNYFHSGDFAKDIVKATPRDAVERSAMLPAQNKTINELKKMTEPFRNLGEALLVAGHQRLRDTGVPALRELADAMKLHSAGEGEDPGFVPAARTSHAQRMNALATKLHGISEGALNAALESLQTKLNDPITALATHDERLAARKAKAIFREHLDATFDYMRDNGVKINDLGYGKDYFPRVYDAVYISSHQQEFLDVLQRNGVSNGDKVMSKLMTTDGNEFTVEVDKPGMQHIKPRVLAHIPDAELSPFMQKNVFEILSSYTQQAARRAEWAKRFEDDGRGINTLLHRAKMQGATDEQLATAQKFIRGVDGTLGDTISPEARRLMGNMIVYQNVRLLPLAIFSSVVDPMGVMVRGGTVHDAFKTFKRGAKELVKVFKKDPTSDDATQFAASIGVIDNAMLAHTMSAAFTQGLAGHTARKINDTFFKYNFMEQYNTSMRVGATEAALGFLQRHAYSPGKHSERYLAELGLTRKDVRIGPSGRIKVTVADGLTEAQATKMMAAVNRWVDGAVLRPDSVDQAIWMNDPHFALIAHLKRFTFSFHETILKRVVHEYQNGNYQPAFALASYVPMMIAADVFKGLVQGAGDEPEWKANWGVADYIGNGIERAGLLGTGQFAADALQYGIGGLSGPTLEQLGSAIQVLGGKAEFAPLFLKSMPANAVYAGLLDGEVADPKVSH